MSDYRNPVPGALLPKEGSSGDWLFKRPKYEDHHHQGLDIGGWYDRESGLFDREKDYEAALKLGQIEILSVTDGTVTTIHLSESETSYGNIIVIQDDDGLWYLYGHCYAIDAALSVGDTVRAGQVIAWVGWSGSAGRNDPHLHFEVSTEKLPEGRGPANETKPWIARARIDPRPVLYELGPYPARQTYFPRGEAVDDKTTLLVHGDVETSPTGGFFPLGGNNLWHGGVHLSVAAGSRVVAPFDGTIVAARLDATAPAAGAGGDYGSSNFILIRHEIPQEIADVLHGISPTDPSDPAPKPSPVDSVGTKATNPPDLVRKVKARLHEEGMYAPADPAAVDEPTCDDELIAAIEAFQRTLAPAHEGWPDGNITVGKMTWKALFPADPADPADPATPSAPRPPDPQRTIYCLLMHLAYETLDAKMRADAPWVDRVRLTPRPTDPETGPTAADNAAEEAADAAEAKRPLLGDVGKPDASGVAIAGDPDDVEWVKKRLTRFGDFSGAIDPEYTDELRDAIADFQAAHVSYYRKHPERTPPGYILRGEGTDKALHRTKAKLAGASRKAKAKPINPVLLHRLSERSPSGGAPILTNLGASVSAGESVWHSDRAAGFDASGGVTLHEQIHWEIFSEYPVTPMWFPVEDTDDDLTIDLPAWLYEVIEDQELPPEFARDHFLTPAEVARFYASPASEFLRSARCKFRSEWGMDVAAAIARIDAARQSEIDTTGLQDALTPYMWWDEVAAEVDGFPASPTVWHYNPIEFLGLYQSLIEALAPKKRKSLTDPDHYADLVVRVINASGGTQARATVELRRNTGEAEKRQTSKRDARGAGGGEVRFVDLTEGEHFVGVHGASRPPVPVQIAMHVTNEIEILTDLVGDPPPTGRLSVLVRDHAGYRAKSVRVELQTAAHVSVAEATTGDSGNAHGWAHFDGLAYGDYLALCGPQRDGAPIQMDRRERTLNVRLSPSLGVLEVAVEGSTGPIVDVGVTALDTDGNHVGERRTDADGVSVFELPEGRYDVRCGDAVRKRFHVVGHEDRRVVLRPNRFFGDIRVRVVDSGLGSVCGIRVIATPADGKEVAAPTDTDGIAEFLGLEPGPVRIHVDGHPADGIDVEVVDGARVDADVTIDSAHHDGSPATTGEVEVVVRRENGKPLARIDVRLSDGAAVPPGRTGGKGTVLLGEVPPGRYRVEPDAPHIDSAVIDVAAGRRNLVQLRQWDPASRTVLTVLALDDAGVPVEGAIVTLSRKHPRVRREEKTSTGGFATFMSVDPGHYDVQLAIAGSTATSVDLQPLAPLTIALEAP
jgi:murein DD-endopeptidase MepM/ murein hydrolase activator NlpD